MRHFKLFDSNFSFVQPPTNLRFVGAFQPKFDCFLNHLFRVLRRFALTDDSKFGTICDIPTIFARLNHRGEFRKFHLEEFTSPRSSWPIVTLILREISQP